MSANDADGAVTLERRGAVAHVTFDRPAARNAMTRQMYGQLHAICDELQADAAGRAAAVATLATAAPIWFLSFGIWQTWWLSVLILSTLLTVSLIAPERS